jgi:anti-sigma28 factor (negative regulator of flagellin synthesis)
MTVDGLGRSGAPQPDARRTDAAAAGAAITAAAAAERPRAESASADTVQLSAEALALAAEQVPSNEIEPIRLREITRKIGEGEYEAPPSLDILTDRILKALRGGA